MARRLALVRTRLLLELQERFTAPVTVVAAPAGFGKTTLLAQAVAENRLAPRGLDRWLTCTSDDAAASSLLDGLGRAVGLDSAPGGERAAEAILDALWHRSPTEVALLLDDVHEIPPGSPGAEVLAQLVAGLPRNGHLVLAGREPPPVPLSRLTVEGRVRRLGEADLRFGDDELVAFADQRGVPRQRLLSSGGWPALAELAASAEAGVEAAYLWEEVLARIEPARRRDLALLAHVGAFDEALAAAAVGHDVDPAALTADFPLVGTTAGGTRQLHPLWRPHLAAAVGRDEIAAARRRAGRELARSGETAAAVRLLAEAEAWDDLAGVVVDALGAARPPVPGDVVATWLGRLPPSMAGHPLARLLDALSTVETDPDRGAERLVEASATFRDDGDIAGELACIAQLTHLAWWSEEPERLVGVAARLFEMEAAGHRPARPLACLARALLADVTNDSPTALAELGRIEPGALNDPWQGLVEWLRSSSLAHLGRPAEAVEAADRALALAGPLHAPMVEVSRLGAVWLQGGAEEALRRLPPLVAQAEATGLRNFTAVVAATCATLLASAGRAEEAASHLERARRAAPSPAAPLIDVNVAIAEATIRVAREDEAGAAEVLDRYLERSPHIAAGLPAFPQQRSLTLWYVLVPRSRPVWDALPLGPYFTEARDLARSVVGLRAGGRLPRQAPPLPAPALARAVLPLPWATELALAHIAADDEAGWLLLEAVWPQAHRYVRRHAADARAALGRPARAALGRLPIPPAGRLDLRLLGPVELRRDEHPVDTPEWRRQRVRSLLAHLVLHRPVSRDRLADDLWPDLDADAQSRNLRVTLTRLLRVLEPDRGERDASFLVRPHGGGLLLHRGEWFAADVWTFDDLWQRATAADRQGLPSAALESMQRAVALWRGDPTELAADEWAVAEVEERRLRLVNLAARAGELLLARDEPGAAADMGELALRADPWCERAHHLTVRAHVAARDDRGARAALARYRRALAELGIDAPETAGRLEPLARLLPGPGPP